MDSTDSTLDTLKHSRRVDELMLSIVYGVLDRVTRHDQSKMEDPEKPVFDSVTPRLKTLTYGSDEYKASLAEMGPALAHHYENNRHHPEHFPGGVDDMTLVDVIEMLCDWKAATERHDDGNLITSLEIQRERFDIQPQVMWILENTAREFGWMPSDVVTSGRAE